MAKIKQARRELERALESATFYNAGFGNGNDKYIKQATSLYRQTWLIPHIVNAIKDIDPCKHCEDGELNYDICPNCDGYGIAEGLSFDPYELNRRAYE